MSKDESIREKMFASISSWQARDLSQKEWCRQQEISYHIFHYWYRRYGEQQLEPPGDNGFVRLSVNPPTDASCELIFADGTKIIFREPMIYASDGKLNIDNIPVENCIRPVAIGRKNYLFAGGHEAAQRSAMLYSQLGTCKLQNINPFTWLKNVLEVIPSHPINKIQQLLPYNWKPVQ